MQFHSSGERTGEQEDTEHLDSPCLALLATKQVRADHSIALLWEDVFATICVMWSM